MKVERMGIKEVLRRIWLISANKIKTSESVSKQSSQLIIVTDNCSTEVKAQFKACQKYYDSSWIIQYKRNPK